LQSNTEALGSWSQFFSAYPKTGAQIQSGEFQLLSGGGALENDEIIQEVTTTQQYPRLLRLHMSYQAHFLSWGQPWLLTLPLSTFAPVDFNGSF
jgi:hypothetical protein